MTRKIFQELRNTNPHLRGVLYKKTSHVFLGVFFVVLSLVPIYVFAVLPSLPPPIATLKTTFTGILNIIAVVLVGLAFVVFLWGIYKYITTASLEGKAGAKETIIYGLIGLFVMLAAWGLVNILLGTFSFTASPAAPTPPKAYKTET